MFKRSSSTLRTWVVMGVGAFVLALAAFAVVATISPNSIFAQTPPPMPVMLQHEENDSGPVTTFLAEDPEGASIDWDVTGTDAMFFMIDSQGVLKFRNAPDFEKASDMAHAGRGFDHSTGNLKDNNNIDNEAEEIIDPMDEAGNNTYAITVRATEKRSLSYPGRVEWTETEVRVEVLNVEEDGKVQFNWREPEVGVEITATLTDPDDVRNTGQTPEATSNPVWMWYTSTVRNPQANVDDHWAAIPADRAPAQPTPSGDDVTYSLAFTPTGANFSTQVTTDDTSNRRWAVPAGEGGLRGRPGHQ